MSYKELFRVDLAHPYYRDGRCPDFGVRADAATARFLSNHRLIVKERPDGFRVLIALDGAGAAILPLAAGAALRFELELRGAGFAYVTDMTGLDRVTAPRFTNVGAADEDGGELLRTGRDEDPALARLAEGVFAAVEIVLEDGGDAGNPRGFQVAFPVREARWTYYCVTDLADSDGVLGLLDSATADPVLFSGANRLDLSDSPDPADPVAGQLTKLYPDLRHVRFVSDAAVACREAPVARVELQLDGVRLTGPLPTPSARHLTKIGGEDSFFQIVRYLT